jgi:predicted nucleic acid-binding protein
MPDSFLMSAIVLMELTSSAADISQRKLYEEMFRVFQKEQRLIVPNDHDWLFASKILFLLTQGRKRTQKGRLKQLPAGVSQHLALDVLIAVSARRWKAQVVTENWSDFKAIQRYCDTRIIRARDFF